MPVPSLDMMRVSQPPSLSFPPRCIIFLSLPLPLISSACLHSSVFLLPSHSGLMRTFIPTEVCVCVCVCVWLRVRGRGGYQLSSSTTSDLPCLSPSAFLRALLSLFSCLPVHLTVGIKELSLNCCQCQWLSCLPREALMSPVAETGSPIQLGLKGWSDNGGQSMMLMGNR